MTEAYQLLREAVLGRHQVSCADRQTRWTMCPHLLGRKNGREHLLSFLVRGGPGLRSLGRWRCFDVAELSEVRLNGGAWATSRDGQPEDCVDLVDVRAALPARRP